MNTRRTAIWLGSLFGGLLYLFILAAGPIWGASSPQSNQLRTCPQQAGNPDNCGFPSGRWAA
ncbi:hypothetical protein [Pseudomonas aeruginosa]|uniref:hypothetical protein n=1 Tax=Pseudomonas aeruginosa TaxID=287 RepID=UPI001419BBB4|nr:hypothetical protein [Pseudomonas aeruginosa]MBV6141961.1 hypothetical protein [Pseudomonas aeruginosa]MBX6146986.1 hypothetical protein [Pseudomonas aeruginosa]MDJ1357032.1 hypothetical protein [Pseudomonas aeruginosa]MDP5582381.1 hypothetical protein [Pseudomonas aeruginosa]